MGFGVGRVSPPTKNAPASRKEAFLTAPQRSSAATMVPVQRCCSPTSAMRSAIRPRGWRTTSERILLSSRNPIVITDPPALPERSSIGGNSSSSIGSVARAARSDLGRAGSISRANARASTGPKTAQDMARAARNAHRHGLIITQAVVRKRSSALSSTTHVSRPVANAPVSMLIRFGNTSGRSLGVCP
jgi:hypothetical protein